MEDIETVKEEEKPVRAMPQVGQKARAYSYTMKHFLDVEVESMIEGGKHLRFKVRATDPFFADYRWQPMLSAIVVAKCQNCSHGILGDSLVWIIKQDVPPDEMFHANCPSLEEEERIFRYYGDNPETAA